MIITKIFKVDALNPDEDIIMECCRMVLEGKIVAFPTETVYGLGASAFNSMAVRRIFIAKGRPLDNPLIVHISKLNHLEEIAEDTPEEVWKLIKKVWPGPLTVILKKNRRVVKEVTAGLDTVAVRMPAHPVALKLIDCSTPLAAPSANLSGRPSPTSGHHVVLDMYGRADAIIDAGETFFGVESTIINLVTDPPILLRPGPIPVEILRNILGKEIVISNVARGLMEGKIALAPGMKYRHYAPQTRIILIESKDYRDLVRYASIVKSKAIEFIRQGLRIAIIASRETAPMYRDIEAKILIIGSRENMYEVAKNLFSILREVDKLAVDIAIAEGFPEESIGLAIMNRLRKASGYTIIRV